jgi:hypothetical protein
LPLSQKTTACRQRFPCPQTWRSSYILEPQGAKQLPLPGLFMLAIYPHSLPYPLVTPKVRNKLH